MWQYAFKTIISAVIIVAVAEVSKRSVFWAALIASLPLTSLLAFIWLFLDTGSSERVAELSQSILWLLLPSLTLFIAIPLLLRMGAGFWMSLVVACVLTAAAYAATVWTLGRFGIRA